MIKIAKFINYSFLIFFISGYFSLIDKCDAMPFSKVLILMVVTAIGAFLAVLFESICHNKFKNKKKDNITSHK